jgi:CO dehydrogenase/acetyl-CoA synthase beta subunit
VKKSDHPVAGFWREKEEEEEEKEEETISGRQ